MSSILNEKAIRKGGGFVVKLQIFDRKMEKVILSWDKRIIKDLKKLDEELSELLIKFR